MHRFLWVRDVDAYDREIVARGARVMAEPRDQPCGIRESALQDPSGGRIVVAQDIEPVSRGQAR